LPTIISESLKIDIEEPYSEWILDKRTYRKKFEETDYVVLFIIDALAITQLQGMLEELWKKSGKMKLCSVVPTTTSNAIASLYIGLPPEMHGIIATKFYLPQIGNFIDILSGKVPGTGFRDALAQIGVRLSSFLWHLPVYHAIPQEKLVVVDLYPKELEGGLRHVYEENTVGVPCATIADLVYSIPEIIRQLHKRNLPGLLIAYSADIDSVGHIFGASDALKLTINFHNEAIDALIKLLEKTAKELGVKIKIIITSDHGQTELKKIIKISEEKMNELQEKGIHIQQSGRFAFVYTSNNEIDNVKAMLEDILGTEDTDILTLEEAVKLGFWPALSDEIYEKFAKRAGQLIILPRNHVDISKEKKKKESILEDIGYYSREFRSSHGGISKEELETPLIVLDIQ